MVTPWPCAAASHSILCLEGLRGHLDETQWLSAVHCSIHTQTCVLYLWCAQICVDGLHGKGSTTESLPFKVMLSDNFWVCHIESNAPWHTQFINGYVGVP